MSEIERSTGDTNLPTQRMVPVIQRMGDRDIEVTFLGTNSKGQPTWILWNAHTPYLIGLLSQGGLGFTFEQRTSAGVMLHEHVPLQRVQRAISS
ncbi:MAG TPA: hypothetical protein VLZ31_00925 [Microbacteriaceae bacterium]|nr:hypothetical protein [Microbacteriaceae bacterium]